LKERWVQSRAVRLSVLDRGEGSAVMLVPAGGRGARDFDAVAEAVAGAGFRAVALNLRGAGGSSGPLEGLTLHDLAGDVAAVIEALGCAPAHVVGHAIGQRVVRCLARDRPELVRSVTALATGGAVAPESEVLRHLVRTFQPDLSWAERVESLRAAWLAPDSDPEAWRDGWWPEQFAAFSAAAASTPKSEWWDAGRAPILAIQGLRDRVAPPANGRALRADFGDRARLVELEGAGHALLPERPEAIARHLVSFLRDVDEGRFG
jgi:pimeloyl-ACP methyl ester carboxylesterase